MMRLGGHFGLTLALTLAGASGGAALASSHSPAARLPPQLAPTQPAAARGDGAPWWLGRGVASSVARVRTGGSYAKQAKPILDLW